MFHSKCITVPHSILNCEAAKSGGVEGVERAEGEGEKNSKQKKQKSFLFQLVDFHELVVLPHGHFS